MEYLFKIIIIIIIITIELYCQIPCLHLSQWHKPH
jgi:hypothetical protein